MKPGITIAHLGLWALKLDRLDTPADGRRDLRGIVLTSRNSRIQPATASLFVPQDEPSLCTRTRPTLRNACSRLGFA